MPELLRTALNLTVVGMGIVFAVLGFIVMIVAWIGRVDKRWLGREEAHDRASLERPPTIDATTAVIIAAAVATWLGGRFRVRSVRRLMRADAPTSPWSAQGRAVLQGSHVITRKGTR